MAQTHATSAIVKEVTIHAPAAKQKRPHASICAEWDGREFIETTTELLRPG
jgi:hypothetical protein